MLQTFCTSNEILCSISQDKLLFLTFVVVKIQTKTCFKTFFMGVAWPVTMSLLVVHMTQANIHTAGLRSLFKTYLTIHMQSSNRNCHLPQRHILWSACNQKSKENRFTFWIKKNPPFTQFLIFLPQPYEMCCRPDMTFAVDWALINNYLSIFMKCCVPVVRVTSAA